MMEGVDDHPVVGAERVVTANVDEFGRQRRAETCMRIC